MLSGEGKTENADVSILKEGMSEVVEQMAVEMGFKDKDELMSYVKHSAPVLIPGPFYGKRFPNEGISQLEREELDKLEEEELKNIPPMSFLASWDFLSNHPMIYTDDGLPAFIDGAVKVSVSYKEDWDNPDSEDGLMDVNTLPYLVWVEFGPYLTDEGAFDYDTSLDSFGSTFEEAFIRLVRMVRLYYGTYEVKPDITGKCIQKINSLETQLNNTI